MNRMSKFLALGMVAGLGLALALVMAPDGRAAVSTPALSVGFSSADVDHAHRAFDAFRNRLDGAPRPAAPVQGERADCGRHTWPYIPPTCQSSSAGQHLRQIRTVALDQPAR
ncbi:MAG: hypothetical protein FD152_528 [Xanthobacteraceae bacterium]|nr:MAG: hypothetical protein FD152_528 [Xanthobacteraceae bacterium]